MSPFPLRLNDTGYDCSRATSDVRNGHAFMVIGGLRFDTGGRGGNGESGPRWKPEPRKVDGHAMRHPRGL